MKNETYEALKNIIRVVKIEGISRYFNHNEIKIIDDYLDDEAVKQYSDNIDFNF